MKTKYFIYSFMVILLLSCNNKQTIYSGEYQNQQVTVDIKTTTTFSSSIIDYYIQLGDLEPVSIDAYTIDLYGRPYSYSIFKNIPYRLIGPDTITYKSKIGNNDIKNTMLYIDPKQHDIKSYKAYADFFAEKWPEIEKELHQLKTIYFNTHLIGVAYVKNADLIKYFRGKKDGQPYYFEITPDGVISFHEGTPEKSDFNLQGSGLADKIKMPGEMIRIMDTMFYNKSRLRQFKDKNGKSMEDYFTVEMKPDNNQ